MKTYKITVNGTAYDVTVEETGSQGAQPVFTPAPAPAAAPAPAVKKAPAAPAPAAPVPAGGTTVSSPMPGTILKVNVKAGDAVKKGDVLVVLEAMKMENEIMAPSDGKVASVNTNTGASVNAGDVLVVLA